MVLVDSTIPSHLLELVVFSHYENKTSLFHYLKFALTAFYETELLSEELTVSSLSLFLFLPLNSME